MKRFTKHWIGWGISDRVIPEGDPGILGSVCGGVFGDPTNGGLGRGGKMERVALLPCGLSGVLFPVFTVFPPETGLFALPG